MALQVGSESELLLLHASLELGMSHSPPILEQSVHLHTMQGVPGVGLLARLALIDGKVCTPCLPDLSLGEQVTLLSEEAIQAAVLLLVYASQLFIVITLSFDSHVHLNESIIASRRVLIVIALVLTHVDASHFAILVD